MFLCQFAGFAPYPFQHSPYSRMTSSYFMKTMFIVKLRAIVSVSGVLVVATVAAILAVCQKVDLMVWFYEAIKLY